MDFSWSEEQRRLREAATALGREKLNDDLVERDRRGEFNREGWSQLARFGIQGLPVPATHGGMGLDALTTVGVLEALGYGCRDNGLMFSVNAHMWTVEVPLVEFGTDEQKQRFLPRLVDGTWIGGNAMSEPGAGSDAHALVTRAERRGDHYVLNGSKIYVTNGSEADVVVAFASTDPSRGPHGISAFLVERDSPGLRVGARPAKMGLRTSPMSELFFDDCEVPAANLLGREGGGGALFTHAMTWERSCILASAVGSMQRLLETCIAFSKERKQFGRPIGSFQLVADKIVNMKLGLETARGLLYQAAWLRSRGRSIFLEAALAKLHISETWVRCAQDAIQLHGAYGYMEEAGIERELRDALGSRIYSGTSEIQRTIIASLLGLRPE